MKTGFFTTQVGRFLSVGVLAVGADYTILYTFTEYLHILYYFSVLISGTVNVVISFFLQRKWTFKSKESMKRQVAPYVLMRIAIFVTNPFALYLLVENTKIHYMLAQLFLTVVLSIVSYIFSKKIFASKALP